MVLHLVLFMFPSVVGRPEMLCIMADMDQKDSTLRATLAVACVRLVFLMTLHPALCAFTLLSAVLVVLLVMLGIMVGMDQKDKLLLAVACAQLVFLVTLHLALCSFPVFRPVMLDIMASMDLKDSFMRDFPWRFHRCSSWTRLSCPLCATTYALVQLLAVERVGLWEMTSGLSPYSALRLVQQRIHAVRQSTRLSGRISHIST